MTAPHGQSPSSGGEPLRSARVHASEAFPARSALVWPERDGTRFVYRFDPDPAGEMAIASLPVGAVELRRRPGAATDVERWSAIATGQIEAGGTAELTVR